MKVLKAKIDLVEGYANDPRLQVLVDKMPKQEDLIFDQKGTLYFAELDGYVQFFHYEKPGQGYGGAHYFLHVKDERSKGLVLKELIGPWSSRSGCMNNAGFTPCIEVSITDNAEDFDRGYTFYAGDITIELAKKAIDLIPGARLMLRKPDNEIAYVASFNSVRKTEKYEVIYPV